MLARQLIKTDKPIHQRLLDGLKRHGEPDFEIENYVILYKNGFGEENICVCGKREIKKLNIIKSKITENEYIVGSSCINCFEVKCLFCDSLTKNIHRGSCSQCKRYGNNIKKILVSKIEMGKYNGSSYKHLFLNNRSYLNYLLGNWFSSTESVVYKSISTLLENVELTKKVIKDSVNNDLITS
jgi:hypothetical protein